MLDPAELHGRRLQRAIGVIYRPETERISHYFHARIAQQFDAVIHLDETHALEPLERTSQWETGELPEPDAWGVEAGALAGAAAPSPRSTAPPGPDEAMTPRHD